MENNNTFDLTNNRLIGTVQSYDRITREIEVFIPKLTPTLYSNGIQSYKVLTHDNTLKIVNRLKISSRLTRSNVIRCKSRYAKNKMPTIGSKVYVEFFEDDINKPLWSMFDPYGDMSDIIDEEKYDDIATVKINNNTMTLKTSDILEIKLPSTFSANMYTSPDDSKHKVINITENVSDIDFNSIIDNITYLNNSIKSAYSLTKDTLSEFLASVKIPIIQPLGDLNDNIQTSLIMYNSNNKALIDSCNDFNALANIKDTILLDNNNLDGFDNKLIDIINRYTDNNKEDMLDTYKSNIINIISDISNNSPGNRTIHFMELKKQLSPFRSINIQNNVTEVYDNKNYIIPTDTNKVSIQCEIFDNVMDKLFYRNASNNELRSRYKYDFDKVISENGTVFNFSDGSIANVPQTYYFDSNLTRNYILTNSTYINNDSLTLYPAYISFDLEVIGLNLVGTFTKIPNGWEIVESSMIFTKSNSTLLEKESSNNKSVINVPVSEIDSNEIVTITISALINYIDNNGNVVTRVPISTTISNN